jgi:sugar lactone lactonase YvrE
MRASMIPLLFLACVTSTSIAGTIDTVAGTGQAGSSGDGGAASAARLREPFHCEFDRQGNLLVADAAAGKIRRIDLASGLIATVAGDGSNGLGFEGANALEATVGTPYAMAVDTNGDLYIVDQKTPVVRKVDGKTGRASTFAGTGKKGYSGDGGLATQAMLREPNDCCLDGRGGLLIADVAGWTSRRASSPRSPAPASRKSAPIARRSATAARPGRP